MPLFTTLNIIGNLGMSWLAVPVFVLVTFVSGGSQIMTGGSVAPEFRGEGAAVWHADFAWRSYATCSLFCCG